jgi:hypothetical protein
MSASIYNTPIEVVFEKPIEIKKGKTYLIKTAIGLSGDLANHIIKQLNKQTGAKFVIINGSSVEITVA